jgi:hypothetical protein
MIEIVFFLWGGNLYLHVGFESYWRMGISLYRSIITRSI